jgi:hypothetical protein
MCPSKYWPPKASAVMLHKPVWTPSAQLVSMSQ